MVLLVTALTGRGKEVTQSLTTDTATEMTSRSATYVPLDRTMSPLHLLARQATAVSSWMVKTPESIKILFTALDKAMENGFNGGTRSDFESNRGNRSAKVSSVLSQVALWCRLPLKQPTWGVREEWVRRILIIGRGRSLYHGKKVGWDPIGLLEYVTEGDEFKRTATWDWRGLEGRQVSDPDGIKKGQYLYGWRCRIYNESGTGWSPQDPSGSRRKKNNFVRTHKTKSKEDTTFKSEIKIYSESAHFTIMSQGQRLLNRSITCRGGPETVWSTREKGEVWREHYGLFFHIDSALMIDSGDFETRNKSTETPRQKA